MPLPPPLLSVPGRVAGPQRGTTAGAAAPPERSYRTLWVLPHFLWSRLGAVRVYYSVTFLLADCLDWWFVCPLLTCSYLALRVFA